MSEHRSLVTGGCGFVGRHLVRALLERGDTVWVIDDLSTGQHPDGWSPAGTIEFIHADAARYLADQLDGADATTLPDFDDVFHLASVVGGRALIDGDPVHVATDLAIDARFWMWATRRTGHIGRVLYASSSAAYPTDLQMSEGTQAIALREEMIRFDGRLGQPDMTYGWSKLSGEYLGRLAAERYGLHVACVRPFSGYGPDQDDTYPIPAIARRVARREDPLTVWGTGRQGRDFVDIEDCISGMFLALDRISDGDAVNIGSGTLTTFLEVVALYAELEGYTPEIRPLVDKPMGVVSRYADPTRIQSWGWRPTVSLRDGLARVLSYAHQVIVP